MRTVTKELILIVGFGVPVGLGSHFDGLLVLEVLI
jgi:hypothetical protein